MRHGEGMLRTTILALLAALLAAAPAAAAPISASATDPVDATGGPSVDLEQVRSSFDSDAGAWSVTVRLYAAPSDTEWAMINAVLWGPSPDGDGCAGTELARSRASTKPSSGGSASAVSVSATGDFTRAPAESRKTMGPGEREVTLSIADPALAGLQVRCVSVNLSHDAVLDTVAPPRFGPNDGRVAPPPHEIPRQPLPPQPGAGGTPLDPTGPPTGPSALPPAIRFPPGPVTLRVRRDGSVRVALRPFARAANGRIVLRSLRGAVLGAGPFSARAGRAVTVKVRLNRTALRALRRARGRQLVRLTATAVDAAQGRFAGRSMRVRLVR